MGFGELAGVGDVAGTGGEDGFDSGEPAGVWANAAAVPEQKTSVASAARSVRGTVDEPSRTVMRPSPSVRGYPASSSAGT